MCWPAASLSGKGTVGQQTARPSSGQWTQLQRSSVPLSHPSWTFSLHDAPAKPTASWRTPPTPPTVSSSSCHQEDGTGASDPAPPDCSTAFSPGCESPELKLPRPPLKPHVNPYLLKHGPSHPPSKHPQPTTPKKKNCMKLFCAIQSVLHHRWVGLYKTTCSNTLFSMRTRHFSHLLCVHNPTKRLSNICMFTCSCTTTNQLALFPSQLLDSQCFSLHMYSNYVKYSYNLF